MSIYTNSTLTLEEGYFNFKSNMAVALLASNADALSVACSVELFTRSAFLPTPEGFKAFSKWLKAETCWTTDDKRHKCIMARVKRSFDKSYGQVAPASTTPASTTPASTTPASTTPATVSDIQAAITLLKTAGYMIFDSSMNEV
jgi:hypothetical protein